jgi:pimeloyl-ACP methyl ester carboxylesterase
MLQEMIIDTTFGQVFGMSAGNPDSRLVLGIHGMSQRNGWQTWEPLLYPLAEAGYFSLSVDMPGWGKSQLAKETNFRTADAVMTARDIIKSLDKQPAAVMGKSWGGGIAFQLALEYPDLVSKLIVTAPAFPEISRLDKLCQPVLMAWAQDDSVIPISYAAEYVAVIPDIELVTYDKGGHSAAPKNAVDFSGKAIRFLEKSNVARVKSNTH